MKARTDEASIVESATVAIESILRLPILDRHKRDLIDTMLWKMTEARGKWKTRYRSRAAREAGKCEKLQHEHVYTRKDITDQLLAAPSQARKILRSVIGCVVTKEEHDKLTAASRKYPDLKGWQRYEAAGIEVVDMDADRCHNDPA